MVDVDRNELPSPGFASGAGGLVVIVGPSGAGKDTLMAEAARHFAASSDVHFVRRVITRDCQQDGEQHDSVSQAEFTQMKDQGFFAVSWLAHGLMYGIPATALGQARDGGLVVANGSRSALPLFARAFQKMKVLNVTARPDILAARLEARGRETRDDILRRLERSSLEVAGDFDVTTIDNSATVDEAASAMIAALQACRVMQKQ